MTRHKDIQNPKNFSEAHYKFFEIKLFSEKTSKEELEDICMTLGHLPTKEAQDLLAKFKESERASEVEWLECAVEEGKFHYMCSNNEKEERDLIAIKLYHKKVDEIVYLMGKQSIHEFRIKEYQIELDALKLLLKTRLKKTEKEDVKIKLMTIENLMQIEKNQLEKVVSEIEMMEKINGKIKETITTERYKDLESWDVSSIHFDGEEW